MLSYFVAIMAVSASMTACIYIGAYIRGLRQLMVEHQIFYFFIIFAQTSYRFYHLKHFNKLIDNMKNHSTNKSLILGQTETYNCETQRIWAWHKVTDTIEGVELRLSNMAGGFPFEAAGHNWATSEQLYLEGEFTDSAIQQEIASAKSGYAAKRFIKAKYKKAVRDDFANFRLQWMLWCVWQKCIGNQAFRQLLISIPDDVILVEDTTTDNGGTAQIWGCKNPAQREAQALAREAYTAKLAGPIKSKKKLEIEVDRKVLEDTFRIGTYTGQNNIGKMLMICRECLINSTEPPIDYELLNSAHITIFGKVLNFPK